MKKIFSIFSVLAIAALSMFTVSCSSDEIIVSEPQQTADQTYNIRIPASFNEGSRAVSFDDGDDNTKGASKPMCEVFFYEKEKVYVYNATKKAMLTGNLYPSEISEDGKSCVLIGELTGTIEKGDELNLFYNLKYERRNATNISFNYNSQNGLEGKVVDGAEAKLAVSDYSNGTLTTIGEASFKILQSMFRFEFVDEKNDPVEKLVSLKVKSDNNALIRSYYPLKANYDGQNKFDDYEIDNSKGLSGYIYTAIRIDEKKSAGDVLRFIAFDKDGNLYKGTKDAPKDGFKNGRYYYNSSAINLTKYPLTKPEIEWINVKDEDYMDGSYGPYYYTVYSPNNDKPIEFGISKNCNGYGFYVSSKSIIHLKDLTAIMFEKNINRFIWIYDDLNLDITGENSIVFDKDVYDAYDAIPVQCDKLKLSGNGTLTVTSNKAENCGVLGIFNYNTKDPKSSNYNNYENTGELDVSEQLAEEPEKTTVIRSARTDNADGTYTWTYTVKPKEN